MCLNTNQTKARRAEKDIVCYKLLFKRDGNLVSPYQRLLYPKNGVKISRFSKDDFGHIERGIHTFLTRNGAIHEKDWFGEGEIKKMFIPKNALYYEGTYDGFKSLASLELKFYSTKKKKP